MASITISPPWFVTLELDFVYLSGIIFSSSPAGQHTGGLLTSGERGPPVRLILQRQQRAFEAVVWDSASIARIVERPTPSAWPLAVKDLCAARSRHELIQAEPGLSAWTML